jgi:hypothetical protein
VTAARESLGERPATAEGHGRPADTPDTRSRLPVSVVALSAAAGVVMVAAAYTAGRLGRGDAAWADRGYWLGQLLILTPVAARLLSRRALIASETVTLIVVLTVAEYLVKVCYSPAAFSYADELMHWRSATDVTQTGRLFTANNLLPISPYYPGLEEATTALAAATGLSIFTAGLIVAGTAHLLFTCVIFLLFRHISGSHRIAGIAVLLYASESLFQSFDSMFVYQTLALPFFGLTMLAAWKLAAPAADLAGLYPEPAGGRAGWFTVAMLSASATVVTHHVTGFVLVVFLELVTIGALVTRDRRLAGWASVLGLLSAALLSAWIVFVAPSTVSYLQPVIEQVLQAFRAHHGAPPAPIASGPLGNQVLSAVSVLIMSALVPAGWWQVRRRYRRQPWVVALAIGAAAWYATVAVRVFAANGSELAGRASTFVFLPAGFMTALAVVHLTGKSLRSPAIRVHARWRAPLVIAAVVGTTLVLVLNGLVNGWPPYWERLPGSYQVAGAERSVGPEQIASAEWALSVLGPGNRFATDEGDLPVLGSYGDQDTVGDDGYLYTSQRFSPADARQVQAQSIGYLLVDRRLGEMLPASGQYFPIDQNAGRYTSPLPLAGLIKFDHIPGVARVYDSGDIVIYDLEGSAYYGP